MAHKIYFVVKIYYSDRYPTTFQHHVVDIAKAWQWCYDTNSPNITAMDVWQKSTENYLGRVFSLSEAKRLYHSLPSKYE